MEQKRNKMHEYVIAIEGVECYAEVAETRNKAIYQSFKKCKDEGYSEGYMQFKALITSVKRTKEI